ncbi:MAG: peptidase [Bdellovibrionaceae bacterium]|nr:peptidase [Pseudobdellovibrionaceae bacterium]|tara:strand:+ start:141691 stop:142587 length:897 start_codon:yes stop_codon:yes gene_type:complete
MAKINSDSDPGQEIVIDRDKGLVFRSEEELYKHFEKDIEQLESQFFNWRKEADVAEKDFDKFEHRLTDTLEDPDEIWRDNETLLKEPVCIYLKVFEKESARKKRLNKSTASEEESVPREEDLEYYVAVTYLTDDVPSFIYLHFPSTDIDLVERFRDGDLVFSKALEQVPPGAIMGDAMTEGDELALGLYESMLVVRSSKDIDEDDFQEFAELRERAVEEADEIWRRDDGMGNILVTFVRDFADEYDGDLWYVVVTVEDSPSNSHSLLFSFPTQDKTLLDRYRLGENLQAEEVVQESSH